MAASRETPDVIVETGSGSGLKWFAIGALVGAGLGLLLAPQSGERTRKNLVRRARKLRDQAEEKFEELTEEVGSRGKRIKEAVDEWADDVLDEARDVERVVERPLLSAREELDRRLTRARARRHSAVAADGVAEDDEDE